MAVLQKSEFIFVPFNRLSTILPPLKYYIKYIIHKISEIVPPQIAFFKSSFGSEHWSSESQVVVFVLCSSPCVKFPMDWLG